MHILHTIFTKGMAGSERHVAELCNALSDKHDVSLMIRSDTDAFNTGHSIRNWLDARVNVVTIPRKFARAVIWYHLWRLKPDIIHTHLERSCRHLANQKISVPKVATLHIDYRPEYQNHEGLICIADWQRSIIPHDYKGKIFTVGNWTLPYPKLPEEEIAHRRRTLGVGPNDFLIGSVGRLAPEKAYDVLIKAFNQANLPDTSLVIVGDGNARAQLEELRQNNPRISLLGFDPNARDYFQLFDVFVSPSRHEPFGLVILEAMDSERPIICTRSEGPSEFLKDAPITWVDINDVDGMAEALKKVHAARQTHQTYNMEPFSINARTAEIEAIYQELIANKKAG